MSDPSAPTQAADSSVSQLSPDDDIEDDSLLRELAAAPSFAPATSHLLVRGAIIAGKYRIDERIGEGGMGTVFRATDLRLQRDVAIKVHHGRATSLERLRREARLLARLSHPNVVTVLEVGSHEGAPFVVMEYVRGSNARAWALAPGRSWRQIVALYADAARGLAAAHAMGIVHRDFKPDNVLVGDDGRARVADFGLANTEADDSASDVELARSLHHAGVVTEPQLPIVTMAGALVGTPAYVAPEQVRSSHVDARADQFSFCAGLYEAVYGELPFRGRTAQEVLTKIIDGELSPPRHRNRAPRWLYAVIRRGLSPRPEDRFADMDALRAALQRPRSRRRAIALGAAALTLGAITLAADDDAEPRCVDDPTPAWAQQRALIGAYAAARDETVREAWARLDARLDHGAQQWSAARVTACAAQRPGATELALTTMRWRLDCLDEHRELTDSWLAELSPPGDSAIVHLLSASSTWGDPTACIEAGVAYTAAAERGHDDELDDARALLRQARAHRDAGRWSAANALAELAVVHAQSLEDPRLLAESLLTRGRSRLLLARHRDGVQDVEAAHALATRLGDRDLLRDSATLRAQIAFNTGGNTTIVLDWIDAARQHVHRWPDDAGVHIELLAMEAEARADLGEFDESTRLLASAEDLATQAAVPDDVSAEIWLSRAKLATLRGDFGNAVRHAEQARELLERAFGAAHFRVAEAWSVLANSYAHAGNYVETRRALQRALALVEGPTSAPDRQVLMLSVHLATIESLLGNSDAALAGFATARATAAALALDEPNIDISIHEGLGLALLDLDRTEEAHAEFVEVVRKSEQRWGASAPELRASLINLALASRALGRSDEAATALERAVRIQEGLADDDPEAAVVYHSYGFALLDRGELDLAEQHFLRAEKSLDLLFGDDHIDHGWPALGLGRIELQRGRTEAALRWFERAATAWSEDGADPQARADLAYSTADALWRGGQRDKAIAVARAAFADRPNHIALRGWLAEHAPGAAPPP